MRTPQIVLDLLERGANPVAQLGEPGNGAILLFGGRRRVGQWRQHPCLAERFGQPYRGGLRNVERPQSGPHRNADAGVRRFVHRVGHAGAFPSQNHPVVGPESEIGVPDVALCRQQDQPSASFAAERAPRFMANEVECVDIVHSSARRSL